LQQSKWLSRRDRSLVSYDGLGMHTDLTARKDVNLKPGELALHIKTWKNEIKKQENVIVDSQRNALNPDQQVTMTSVSETECASEVYSGNNNHEGGASIPECAATEALNINLHETRKMSDKDIIAEIGSQFSLNPKQWIAFRIIADHFMARYVNKTQGQCSNDQLIMLMTGLGGTGKTHVIKAVQSVMQHYGCTHIIRFLAPTGSAAALIDGMTVHKGLGIKIKSNNKGKGNRNPGNSSEDYFVLISIQNCTQL
jgi:hypothetical protein